MPRRDSYLTDEDGLCCCEFINLKGERSHIMAVCCDCEDLDNIVEHYITKTPVEQNKYLSFLDTVLDRLRIPWFGGAVKLNLQFDVITPIFIIPLCIMFAGLSVVTTILSFILMPVAALYIYGKSLRFKQNTRFYYAWCLTSCGFLMWVFEFMVLSYREVHVSENVILICLSLLALYMLHVVKGNPGIVGRPDMNKPANFSNFSAVDVEVLPDATNGDFGLQSTEKLVNCCEVCNVEFEPRVNHCKYCNMCIDRRDHHCIWINHCIGANNHRSFIICLILCIMSLCYGSHLTMTTVCTPEMFLDYFLFPVDCEFVYTDIHIGMCFASAVYASTIAALCCLQLVQQVILISRNLTWLECRRARHNGLGKCGFFTKSQFTRGCCSNCFTFWFRSPSRNYLILSNN